MLIKIVCTQLRKNTHENYFTLLIKQNIDISDEVQSIILETLYKLMSEHEKFLL